MGLRSILAIGFNFFIFSLSAQPRDFQEEVHLSLNTTNILVGETLHFSAFVYSNTTKKLSKLSSVLYIELIDETGAPVYQTKIGLREGRGSGRININPKWMSSTYRIVAYTKWMRNYGSFFEQNLLVLNPYVGLTNNYEISGNPSKTDKRHQKGETYAPLQQITMNIGAIEPATLSVAVSEKPDLFYTNDISLENPPAPIDSYVILPEYKYALVQGRIKDPSEKQAKRRINMAVKGESVQVTTTHTDEYGRFWMNYNPDISSNEAAIQIQFEGDSIEQLDVVSEFYDSYSQLNSGRYVLDSALISKIIARSIHSQIQNAYKELTQLEPSGRDVYSGGEEAIVYYLDEYKRFTSMRDTFIELTILVGVSKSEESDHIFVRCEQPPGLISTNRSPLILLDGLRVAARTILDYPPNEIEKIEVVPAYYFVNDVAYKGLISVHTFRGSGNMTPSGYTFPLSQYQSYSNEGYRLTITDNLPHYEPNIFWKPIHGHDGGELDLNFSTSRLEGNFEVSITGITNSGKPVNIKRYFQVSSVNQ